MDGAFTPTDPHAFSPATSPSVTMVVTGATATSTALTTSPASPVAYGTPVTLTATITPAAAAGSVQFKDGTTNVGNPVAVVNGMASRSTSKLVVGTRADRDVHARQPGGVYCHDVADGGFRGHGHGSR